MAPAKKYTPEDKNQVLVVTPYGRGLVIRSSRDDGIMEVQLTEWEMASSRRGFPTNAMLYTTQNFPSVKPLMGDHVICQWGRGVIKAIRKDGTIVVEISSWRLANRSLVKCYLEPSALQVVRKKTQSEMDVYERVELSNEYKALANKQFAQKLYEPALLTYSKAVDAVRYVQHESNSSNEIRADLVVAMITCSNNAGTCSIQLHKWDQAIKFATNALVLIDALYPKRGGKIHTILKRDGYPDSKIFGEWRVKSYLIMARAQFERKDYDEALKTLQRATIIVNEFNEKTAVLVSQEKEVSKLKAHCEREDKAVKRLEKKRARAMFGGGTSPNKDPSVGQPKNGIEAARSVEFSAPVAVSGAQVQPIPSSEPDGPMTSSGEIIEPHTEEKSASKLMKRVSFSVPEVEEFEDEEVPWFAEHWEALTVTAVAIVVAVGVGVAFGGRRKQ